MEDTNVDGTCMREREKTNGELYNTPEDRHATPHENFSKPSFQNSRDVKQQVIKLKAIKTTLSDRFSCLSIHQTISKDHVPFIHIWKPILQLHGVQGMPFLPCFHIIVTMTTFCDVPKAVTSREGILFQLHSFHGKVCAINFKMIHRND